MATVYRVRSAMEWDDLAKLLLRRCDTHRACRLASREIRLRLEEVSSTSTEVGITLSLDMAKAIEAAEEAEAEWRQRFGIGVPVAA